MYPETTIDALRLVRLDATIESTRRSIREQEERLARKNEANREVSEEFLDVLNRSLDSLQYLRHVLLMYPRRNG